MLLRIKNWILENKFLLLILLFAIFLLIYRISYRTFWMDETMVLNYLKFGPLEFLKEYWRVPDNHPPLYYFLVLLVSKILPWNEFGIRLISIVFGFGIVILVYFFTFLATENKRSALLASFFTAFSSYFMLVSQMARYHSIAGFFALLTLYLFLIFLLGNSKHAWHWYLVAMVLTAYSDYPHFFYVAVLTNLCYLYCLIRRRAPMSLLKWLLGQIVATIFCLPLVYMLYNRIVVQGDGGWSNVNLLGNSWMNIIGGIFFHVYAYFFGENIFPWNYLFFIIGCLVLTGVLTGFIRSLKNKSLNSSEVLVIFLCVSVIVLNTLFMNVADRRYNFIVYPKFGFVAYPLLIMSFVICLSRLTSKKIQSIFYMLWAVLGLYGLKNFYTATNYLNPSYFRTFESFEFVRDNSHDGQFLAITTDAGDGVYNFYRNKYFAHLIPLEPNELLSAKSGSEVWFFSTGYDGPGEAVSVLDRLPVGYKILRQFDSVPLDLKFKIFKEKILHRPSYDYKYSVFMLRKI